MSYSKEHTEGECDKCLTNVGKDNLIPAPFLYLDRNDNVHPNFGNDYHRYYLCKKCYRKERKKAQYIKTKRRNSDIKNDVLWGMHGR